MSASTGSEKDLINLCFDAEDALLECRRTERDDRAVQVKLRREHLERAKDAVEQALKLVGSVSC